MELVQSLYDFFGFNLITEAQTFPELMSYIFEVFIGVWIVLFVIRSLFMVTSIADRRLF